MYREAFLNPDRPVFWPGEEEHFRSPFVIGDHVRIGTSCGTITGFNNTHSHIRGGRIVHYEPDTVPNGKPYTRGTAWENELSPAQPGDVPAHVGEDRRHVPASWLVTA